MARIYTALIVCLGASVLAQTNTVATSNRAFRVTYGWTAPTLNVDDTPVTDLAGFNLYARPDTNWTRGQDIEAVVLATNAAPTGDGDEYSETVYFDVTLDGAWVAVTAVDFAGNESGWSAPVLFSNYTPRPPPMRILSVGVDWVAETNTIIMMPN